MDIPLAEHHRVLWAGKTLEVLGIPQRWPRPDGGVHHVEARLREISSTKVSATGATATLADLVDEAASGAQQWVPA
jgi:hypothetical protein